MVPMVLAERITQPHKPLKSPLNLNRWKDFVRGFTSFHLVGPTRANRIGFEIQISFEIRIEMHDCCGCRIRVAPSLL